MSISKSGRISLNPKMVVDASLLEQVKIPLVPLPIEQHNNAKIHDPTAGLIK